MPNLPENENPKRKDKNGAGKSFRKKYKRKFLPKDPKACEEKLSSEKSQGPEFVVPKDLEFAQKQPVIFIAPPPSDPELKFFRIKKRH